jgi:hypothetical protein
MEPIIILVTLLLVSVLSPFFGTDTRTAELEKRRWGGMR